MRAAPLALAALTLLAACSKAPEETAPPIRPVLWAEARPLAESGLVFVGIIEPRTTTDYAFRTGGALVSRPVDIGDPVAADQLLASIDATTLELTIQSVNADLLTARAQLANAAATETRQQLLAQSDNVSRATLEATTRQRETAAARVTQAEAAVSKAQEQLRNADLVAGVAGIVTAVGAEPGEVVSPGQSIVTVAAPGDRDLTVDIPEAFIGVIAVGTVCDVALQLDPTALVTGTVREIAPQADPGTRSRRVRIALDAPPPSFWLGTTAAATLRTTGGDTRLLVPLSAIDREGAATKVWVLDPATATLSSRPVTVAAEVAGWATIASGLAAGDRVVTLGIGELSEGQRVAMSGDAP